MAGPEETVPVIEVTVIGGYLGAGKTTLLNHILRTADERIAVLVNDFGDINIDEALVESNDGDTIALTNGCICCSLADGFAAALATVNDLQPRPKRLVIEASGVADPAGVAAWAHGPGLRLDATVVVVDAESIRRRAQDKYVADVVLAQLRAADIALLNKGDLVEPGELTATRDWLRARCPDAVVIDTIDAVVDPRLLFGTVEPKTVEPAHVHASDLFETWAWTRTDGPVGRADIDDMMDGLPDTVVRVKGIVWLDERPDRQMILQRVGRRWNLRPGAPWPAATPPTTQLVFIGVRESRHVPGT